MILTPVETLVTILMLALGTVITRFLPFIIFRGSHSMPPALRTLEKTLPGAIIGMLVVYCLKGVDIFSGSRGLPEAVCVAVIVALHVRYRNTLLSIGAGTACYLILVNLIFV